MMNMNNSVTKSKMAATMETATWAPRARVISPETPVAAAARKKPRDWAAKKPAQTRGKEE